MLWIPLQKVRGVSPVFLVFLGREVTINIGHSNQVAGSENPQIAGDSKGKCPPKKWPETFRFGNVLFLAEFNILRMYFFGADM